MRRIDADVLPLQISFQGNASDWISPQAAHDFALLFPNAVGEVDVHIIHGAPAFFVVTEEFAESVDHLVSQHIESANIIAHEIKPHGTKKEVMNNALQRLADIEGRPEIATRDWDSVFSFSLRPEYIVKIMDEEYVM